MVYRRFGSVFSRLLLYKQDEINRMEAMLHLMDKYDEKNNGGKYLMSRVFDVERGERGETPGMWPESRIKLMERLEKKSLEYGNSLRKQWKYFCMASD